MAFWGNFKKKTNKAIDSVDLSNRISIFDTDYPLDRSDWFQVYSACLGKVITAQNACAEQVVKNRNWNVDFTEGTLAFGDDSYPVRFIGSEASSSRSWMWGWNNINGFDERIIKLACEVKTIGEAWNLEPLMKDSFALDEMFNGHNLSIVACGISKDLYCYYRGPHDGGAVFMAFSEVPASVFTPVDIPEFASTVMKCIQQMTLEHQVFVESFLMWNGTAYDWDGDRLIAHFSKDLLISFEKAGEFRRISNIKTVDS